MSELNSQILIFHLLDMRQFLLINNRPDKTLASSESEELLDLAPDHVFWVFLVVVHKGQLIFEILFLSFTVEVQ